MKSAIILGCRVDPKQLDELIKYIINSVKSNRKIIVSYVNVYALNLAKNHPKFRTFLNQSDIVFCDGVGVALAAWFLKQPIPPRHTPPDWVPLLAKECARNGISFFFLGARPGIAEQASWRLRAQIPELSIAGVHHGYFDKTVNSLETQEVICQINASQADILFVGFGMPAQEMWLADNWDKINSKVALPVGAMFDYLANVTPRAPRWMTDHGLEWLGRLIIEPRRLWRRYLIGLPVFFWHVLLQRFGLLKLKA